MKVKKCILSPKPVRTATAVNEMHNNCITEMSCSSESVSIIKSNAVAMHNKCLIKLLYLTEPFSTRTRSFLCKSSVW